MSRAIYTRRLVLEPSRIYKVTQQQQKNESNMLDRTRWRNKPKTKRNQHCDVTKRSRKSQNNPISLYQLPNNGISLHQAIRL